MTMPYAVFSALNCEVLYPLMLVAHPVYSLSYVVLARISTTSSVVEGSMTATFVALGVAWR